jgi:hypothetical protein
VKFDGATDYISIADHDDFKTDTLTVSGWVSGGHQSGKAIFGQYDTGANKRAWAILSDTAAGTGKIKVIVSDNGEYASHAKEYVTSTVVLDRGFHHVAFTFNSGTLKVYVDGVEDVAVTKVADDPITGIYDSDVALLMGAHLNSGVSTAFFAGMLDEFAVWSRVLDPSEVKQVYLRGASRVKYQVRSCNDNACAGETWIGPDGTKETFFSELNNNSIPLTGAGDVSKTQPLLKFSDFGSNVVNNQYFQYRAIFETGSTAVADSPDLTEVQVGPTVAATQPTIVNRTTVSYFSFATFAETLGAHSCTGAKYQVSKDGTTWYYYNAGWVTATPASSLYAEASTAAVLQANSATFPFSSGTFYFRAFLNSNGAQPCEINQLEMSGTN